MIGIIFVFVSLILLRFFYKLPEKIWNHSSSTLKTLICTTQHMLYWGLLLTGLVLCFVTSFRIGLTTLGAFLLIYNYSVKWDIDAIIPILGNILAILLGYALLIIGLVLLFITSVELGFIAIVCIVGSFTVVQQVVNKKEKLRWKKRKREIDL